jgi:hypothetical protein
MPVRPDLGLEKHIVVDCEQKTKNSTYRMPCFQLGSAIETYRSELYHYGCAIDTTTMLLFDLRCHDPPTYTMLRINKGLRMKSILIRYKCG